MAERAANEDLAFERVVFFSDAVFAIAITLLVLEIKVPHLPAQAGNAELVQAALALLPKFIGFVFSFLVIGSMWIEHHRVFRFIGSYDGGLLWRNLIMLPAVAFMPFPTALYGAGKIERRPDKGMKKSIHGGCSQPTHHSNKSRDGGLGCRK